MDSGKGHCVSRTTPTGPRYLPLGISSNTCKILTSILSEAQAAARNRKMKSVVTKKVLFRNMQTEWRVSA